MPTAQDDFREVAHCGGKVTFRVTTDDKGTPSYQIEYSGSSPTPMSLIAVYALPQGIACGDIQLGGIGVPWNPPPFSDCLPVFIGSDSHGRFGHKCPNCNGYCRSSAAPSRYPMTCPYCGARGPTWQFLTDTQQKYVAHYIETLVTALASGEHEHEVSIDMDAVGDAATVKKPDFYYTEQTQQTVFVCTQCRSWNDIRGQYGYCVSCGWRNNGEHLASELAEFRTKLNEGTVASSEVLKSVVSAFDSCCRNFVAQLCNRVPMTDARHSRFKKMLFHGIEAEAEDLRSAFDIDLFDKISESDRRFLRLMFHRRHVFEHDGGQATARYIRESGDTSVVEGTLIRETRKNVHELINLLNKMTTTFEKKFHELFPPESKPVEYERGRQKRMLT